MPIGEICIREVYICNRNTTISEASQLMRQYHVGDLLMVEERDGQRFPIGIITDRDIVLSVVAVKLDPTVISVGDIVNEKIVTIREDQGLFDVIQLMRAHGIRRMPVVNLQGALAGIVSVDDLIQLLAEEMSELAKLITREQTRETHKKP